MKKGALLVGYARVSKADDQDTAAQVKALREAGCKRICQCGPTESRPPQLDRYNDRHP